MKSKTGTISLYNAEGVRLTYMRYSLPIDRKNIIEGWRKTYDPKKFATFYVQITPDIDQWELLMIDLDKMRKQQNELMAPCFYRGHF